MLPLLTRTRTLVPRGGRRLSAQVGPQNASTVAGAAVGPESAAEYVAWWWRTALCRAHDCW